MRSGMESGMGQVEGEIRNSKCVEAGAVEWGHEGGCEVRGDGE